MAKKPDNTYGLFINGEFRNAKDGKFFDTYSPATKEKIASVAEATKEDGQLLTHGKNLIKSREQRLF